MQGIEFLQNQAATFNVFMASTANPLEGLGGLTLSVQVAKGAGAYATATPTSVFDRGSGSYSVVMPSTAFDTAGVLEFRFTGTGAVASHVYGTVVAERAATVSGVWAHGSRTLTGFGTLAADTATAVWASGTRTLTGFGSLVADIATAVWGAGARTLTAFADSSGVTTLLSRVDVVLSTRSTLTAADVWGHSTRLLTGFGTLTTDTATAVWAAGTRTLTGFGTLVADVATAVWAAGTRTLTAIGDSAGVTTLLTRVDVVLSTRSTLTAADVWAHGTRTLTGFGTLVADIATAVWAAGARTLTAVGDSSGVATLLSRLTAGRATNLDFLDVSVLSRSSHTPAAVWAHTTRTLTAQADTPGTTELLGRLTTIRATNLDRLDVASSAIPTTTATAVWGNVTRTITGQVDVGSLNGNTSAIFGLQSLGVDYSLTNSVQATVANGGISAASFALGAADVIWDSPNRTLSNNAISADTFAVSALTSIQTIVDQAIASTARAEVASIPAPNASLADKIAFLYMLARNRRVQTETEGTLFANDDVTVVGRTSVQASDVNVTLGKYRSGP